MLHVALLTLGIVTLVGAVASLVEVGIGARRITNLVDQQPRVDGPLVSVIVAARDEGPNIEASLASLLAQAYERVEIIAIDDRSVDDTGAILDRMASRDPRIRVLHITELPSHWLGKNHALHEGAALARGELLLFTDADIVFDKLAIARGVAYMDDRGLDHLTLGPELDSPTLMLQLAVTYFALGFLLLFRPWHADNPERGEHMGIGAFNLIRTNFYRGFGGHSRIALRPDDDVKLGRLVKLAGGKQAVAGGHGVIRVRWYSSVGELVRGLRKNTFAGMRYSLTLVVLAVLVQLVVNVWPFVALIVTSGSVFWVNLAIAVVLMTLYAAVAVGTGERPWLAIGYPVAALIFAYILVSSTWITLRRGGIEWRGTFYPLDELRANKI